MHDPGQRIGYQTNNMTESLLELLHELEEFGLMNDSALLIGRGAC